MTTVEHQHPHPVHDAAAYRLHGTDRRHIETETVGDWIVRREWWWEPVGAACTTGPRR